MDDNMLKATLIDLLVHLHGQPHLTVARRTKVVNKLWDRYSVRSVEGLLDEMHLLITYVLFDRDATKSEKEGLLAELVALRNKSKKRKDNGSSGDNPSG